MKNILLSKYMVLWPLLGASASVLAAPTTLEFTSDGGIAWDDGIAEDGEGGSADIAGITIQILNITDVAGTNLGDISWQNNGFLFSSEASYSGLTAEPDDGSKGMAIKSSDGVEFEINGFRYYNWGETETTTVTVKGYRDDAEVASTEFEGWSPDVHGPGIYNPIDVVLNDSFDDVDEVRLYISAGGYKGDQSATNHTINNIEIATVDSTSPTVSSINRVTSSPTNATSIDYTVTFSEDVTGVDTADFSLTTNDTASGTIASVTPVSASTYTVRLNSISGIGTIRLDLKNSGTGIVDGAGNAITTGFAGGQAYTIDQIAPTVTSVSVPDSATYKAGQSLDFIVNTQENVTVNTGDGTPYLSLNIGGTTRAAEYVSGSGTKALVFSYEVQTGDNDTDGIEIGSVVNAEGGTLRDAAGNDLNLTLNDIAATTAVLVDTTVPDAPGTPDLDAGSDTGSSSSDNLTNDTTPTLSGVAEANSTVTITSSEGGELGTATADDSGAWSFTPGSALEAGAHSFTVTATDAAGNVSASSGTLAVTIDTTAPATNGVVFDQTDIDGTNLTAVSFTFNNAEMNALANYTITSSEGGTDVTGSATITDPEGQISGLNVSGLNDGNLTLSVTLTDTAGNVSTAMTDVIAKDADPVLTLPADPAAISDGSTIEIDGVSVSGTDSSAITVELSVAAGTIVVDTSGAAVVTDNETAALTISGSLVEVNAALAGLEFTAAVNSTDDQELVISVDDGVGMATGTLTIPVNDRPDIDELSGNITFVTGSAAVLLDIGTAVTVTDLDNGDFEGGVLNITFAEGGVPAQDLLSFDTEGDVTLANTLHGANVLVESEVVGTLVNDIAEGNTLGVNLNANATPARIALLLQALTYDNTHASPTTGTRTLEITLNDGKASRTISLTVTVQFPPDPAPTGVVISTETPNGNYTGTVTVTPSGVMNGGTVTGTINNSGTITGDVNLGPNTTINGGKVTGNVKGNPQQPARINNANIGEGASVSNVVIGAGSTLTAGVQIGENVKFESIDSIPSGIDLTSALRSLNWSTGDARPVAILDEDVLAPVGGEDPMTIIRAIQLLGDFEPAGNDAHQDPVSGEIVVVTADFNASVLPVMVSQAAPDEPEGVSINEDGDIVFVAVNRRVVLSHPVLVDKQSFISALAALGLQLDYNNRTNLLVEPVPGTTQTASLSGLSMHMLTEDYYHSARPDVLALPAHRGTEPGVVRFPVEGLGSFRGVSLIFESEEGLLEQDIVPIPADWFALKAAILAIPGVADVSISTLGVITATLGDAVVRGMVDYTVVRTQQEDEGIIDVRLVDDLTGNGQRDYEIVYPNGDRQYLFIFSSPSP